MVYSREYLLAKRNIFVHSCYLILKPHIYANNKVKLRQEGGRELRNEQMHYYQ